MSDLLSVLECITPHNLSALWEGDIFSVLLQSPFMIRAFEFGAADGGLDCSTRYPETDSYAERWATFVERPPGRGHKVVLFDVKSTVAAEAGRQRYFTFPLQYALAAFYICVAAGDPVYIDVVPNYSQYADSASAERLLEDKSRKIFELYATHSIWHPPSAYGGVDPTSSPYRMPRALLPAALERIRNCALGYGIYQNPWTKVDFPQWQPALTAQTRLALGSDARRSPADPFLRRWITPTEGTPQFTAYTQAMHI
ncbi:hypothetical protein CKM354_000350700 [Cercospora kikuchii]|uniref:Uncharacterized protein n=1 Tax=Cercospora kikuchii TaxID=84275 RepID=A0A9P3FF47_9PEZI|nr:uncharacterized protein CKM354_000350700 [Cercospora kikuchii]GIZ40155.1 hypothetical protein CKM354_000350700 [Cercospora kikuchii]